MNLQPKNTIKATIPSLYGHWFDPTKEAMRTQAREWARAQGYYDQASK